MSSEFVADADPRHLGRRYSEYGVAGQCSMGEERQSGSRAAAVRMLSSVLLRPSRAPSPAHIPFSVMRRELSASQNAHPERLNTQFPGSTVKVSGEGRDRT